MKKPLFPLRIGMSFSTRIVILTSPVVMSIGNQVKDIFQISRQRESIQRISGQHSSIVAVRRCWPEININHIEIG
ncbi:Uncharacterized protein HZ326_29422 [Fusarium oxysporum f. sp. albedinis]|nr:Uncharacterized protein HZ326_29422 [Fusarium oxysporum f. sp. albedinis]